MNSTLNQQEKTKLRTARTNFFNKLKRKSPISTPTPPDPKSTPSLEKSDSEPPTQRAKLPGMAPSSSSSSASTAPLIVRFYDHDIQAKDSHGRTQEQILSWDDKQLEHSHNYIQMLFPLPEGSPYNFAAPVITREVMDAFRTRSELQDRLRRSFERMLDFYGFEVSRNPEAETSKPALTTAYTFGPVGGFGTDSPSTPVVATEISNAEISSHFESEAAVQVVSPVYHIGRGPKWDMASQNWCVRFDHNHLRITRILRCLRILGLQTECDAFFAALKEVFSDPACTIGDRSMMYWTRAVQRPLYVAPDDEECDWLQEWEDEHEE